MTNVQKLPTSGYIPCGLMVRIPGFHPVCPGSIPKCDRISENGSKSHMKSIVFQHVLNCISSNAHVFSEYLSNSFDNLNMKFHENDMK